MSHLLIYLFPALFDCVLGAALYVNTVRMAESGASATATTAVLAILFGVYTVTSLAVGRIVKPSNAATLLIISSLATGIVNAGFIVFPSLGAVYFIMACMAINMAIFFVAFQVFMKAVAYGKSQGISHATALYTISWSTGIAVGPFISGIVWQMSGHWQYIFAMNILITVVVGIGVFLLRRHAHDRPANDNGSEDNAESAETALYEKLPNFVGLGWVIAAAGCAALGIIGGLFPKTAAEMAIPKAYQGTVIGLIAGSRALAAVFFLGNRTAWMYRPMPLAVFGVFGILGVVGFAFSMSVPMFCLSAISVGIFSAGVFFYMVFHAVIHPAKSAHYIAINEGVVGMSSFVCPLAGGLIADHVGFGSAYAAVVAVVVGALAIQVGVHLARRREVNALIAAR